MINLCLYNNISPKILHCSYQLLRYILNFIKYYLLIVAITVIL